VPDITVAVIFALVSFTIQIIFHELGQCMFGLLTGWKLIYLQIWKIVFYHDRKTDQYKFKTVSCMGFQCIMNPNSIDYSSTMYSLGGLFSNFILSTIGMLAAVKMYYSTFPFLFFLSFTLSGIALLITNGIPKVNNLCNDMACFLLTKDSEVTRRSHNTQLVIASELSQGKTYAMMKEKLFQQDKNTEINEVTAYSLILNYYYHLDRDEFQSAHKELTKVNDFNKISYKILRIYNLEIFYLYMRMSLYGCSPFSRLSLPDRDKENDFRENIIKGDVHSLRVKIVYQAYVKMIDYDINGAIETLEKGISEMNNISCIYPGEKLFCEDQLVTVCNILKRMVLNKAAILS
jgi:hypothetical protein